MSDEALKVFFDGADYVIARDEAQASRLWEGYIGESRADHKSPGWQAIAANEPIAIEVGLALSGREFETMRIGKTAAQWCKAFGVGFLCSTES